MANNNMSNNEEQIEFWNSEVADTWVAQQEIMDATLAPITESLLQVANAQPGERALDIGCGCGDTSLTLAAQGLDVCGVDISVPMLERARSRVSERQAVEFIEADASVHPFNADFDLIFSRFGVMFFSDPVAAFRNIRTAAKAGGRLAFVCWQSPMENDWVLLPMQIVRELLPPMDPPDPLAPGPFAFADPQRLESILRDSGWRDIDIEGHQHAMKMGGNAAEATEFAEKIGPLARMLKELPDDTREQAHAALFKALESQESEDGISLSTATWIVQARA